MSETRRKMLFFQKIYLFIHKAYIYLYLCFFLRLIYKYIYISHIGLSLFLFSNSRRMYAHNSIDMLHIHKRLETVLFQTDYTRRYVAYARSSVQNGKRMYNLLREL